MARKKKREKGHSGQREQCVNSQFLKIKTRKGEQLQALENVILVFRETNFKYG